MSSPPTPVLAAFVQEDAPNSVVDLDPRVKPLQRVEHAFYGRASWVARRHPVPRRTTMSTDQPTPSPEKDPEDWVTGDQPMTGPQRSYLGTLAQEAGEDVPDELTKAEASERIDELQERTGRSSGG